MLDCLSLLAQNRHCFLWQLKFGILLYVWQLYNLNYVKRFKIVFIKFFSVKIYLQIYDQFFVNIG